MLLESHPLPPEFAEPLTRLSDRIGSLVTRVVWYREIGSTNDTAIALADAGAEEGVVVVADAQTAGRGRLGRAWASPAGAGIYATVILRPDARVTPLVSLAAGLAIAEGIEAATGLRTRVKWPNDVFVDGGSGPASDRKLAGILAEGGALTSGTSWVVLGLGINVLPASYPPEVAARATSLEAELGRPVERGLVLAECLAAWSARYGELRRGRIDAVVSGWRARAASTFGRPIEWDADGVVRCGVAQDVDASGALLVSTDGGTARVISGAIRWI